MQYRWDYHPGLTRYEFALFEEALGWDASRLQPLAVAHIDDLRYRFIANTVVAPSYTTEFSIIEIYKPRSGKPYITKVLPIDTDL
jgi:hypothetical protein